MAAPFFRPPRGPLRDAGAPPHSVAPSSVRYAVTRDIGPRRGVSELQHLLRHSCPSRARVEEIRLAPRATCLEDPRAHGTARWKSRKGDPVGAPTVKGEVSKRVCRDRDGPNYRLCGGSRLHAPHFARSRQTILGGGESAYVEITVGYSDQMRVATPDRLPFRSSPRNICVVGKT